MLKLEKTADRKEVAITLQQRQKTLSPLFLKALACAVLFHAIGFLLFTIQYFVPPKPTHLPVTAVDILRAASVVQTEQEKPHPSYPFVLPPSRPVLADIVHKVQTIPIHVLGTPVHSPTTPLTYIPLHIHLSGGLANHKMLSPTSQSTTSSSPLREYATRYIVQVDDTIGKVFWHHLEEGSGNKAIDDLSLNALTALSFQQMSGGNITRGTIEVMIVQPEQGLLRSSRERGDSM